MSRSAAARADHDRALREPRARAPALPRRVSGPARSTQTGRVARPPRAHADGRALAMYEPALVPTRVPRRRTPSRPPLRLAVAGASIALRGVAEAALEVSGSRTMDRLVRSRAWVVIIGFGLIGIVAMQVSMLKLNNGIGRAVETAATLERGNATLRGQISRLSSGARIQALAGSRGFVMPEPADVTYLKAGTLSADGARAARRMRAPDPEIVGPAGLMTTQGSVTAITGEGERAAPAAGAAAPAAPPAAAATGATGTSATATPPAAAPVTAPEPQPAAATGAATATPVQTAPPAAPSGGVTAP